MINARFTSFYWGNSGIPFISSAIELGNPWDFIIFIMMYWCDDFLRMFDSLVSPVVSLWFWPRLISKVGRRISFIQINLISTGMAQHGSTLPQVDVWKIQDHKARVLCSLNMEPYLKKLIGQDDSPYRRRNSLVANLEWITWEGRMQLLVW